MTTKTAGILSVHLTKTRFSRRFLENSMSKQPRQSSSTKQQTVEMEEEWKKCPRSAHTLARKSELTSESLEIPEIHRG